ncbi:peptidyl-prolyl cis-trans isomerase FPR2-like [Contarinia nasturtii]|uniref:peptidyl-prolyl cis-trans isomerase FPR2-like n=1 Tax=Contarinia nasturtii TaxID=265458 RepID=UPI0012D3997D|nr:peptidyl-prolyl cis-trans isomerase FPR2-like [Contarinia nasturtii]
MCILTVMSWTTKQQVLNLLTMWETMQNTETDEKVPNIGESSIQNLYTVESNNMTNIGESSSQNKNTIKMDTVENNEPSDEDKVWIMDKQICDGIEARLGDFISIYFEGWIEGKDVSFSQHMSGTPYKFQLGKNEHIRGWDLGIEGMKTGSIRRIKCPPSLAYGEAGLLSLVPPNATLIFDITLLEVNTTE